LAKNDIEKQVPILKKKFLYYHDFAGKTVQEIFGDSLSKTPWIANSFASGIFYNKGHSSFQFKPLPSSMQEAPLFGLTALQGKGILTGGNYSGVVPYEGRYDADYGYFLLTDRARNYKFISAIASGFLVRGEVRDIKAIRTAKGTIYAVAINNKPIEFFKPN